MRYGERYTCVFCLTPAAYELKLDKKQRPFFACVSCGCKTFLRGEFSLKGPTMLWGPLSIALRNNEAEVARVLVARAAERAQADAGSSDPKSGA